MALYGAIETLHDTEQNRTHPSRNILRDRHLKVKFYMCAMNMPLYVVYLQVITNTPAIKTIHFMPASNNTTTPVDI